MTEKDRDRTEMLLEQLSTKRVIDARYRPIEEIARGGMGAVVKVWDKELAREVAMKVALADGAKPGSKQASRVVSRFLEEAQIAGQLVHPGIVPVHELGLDKDGRPVFIMQLVRGRDLSKIFEFVRKGEQGWTCTRALGVMLKVCEAMAYAHSKGVVHRDLKPSNVMVGRFGEVYVMDWGLARILGHDDPHEVRMQLGEASTLMISSLRHEEQESGPESSLETKDGEVIGTPAYMSPEQARGEIDQIDRRSDVYSLGAMLYHLLTGQMPYIPPFTRATPQFFIRELLKGAPRPVKALAPDAPAELVAICERAMERDKDWRYADMLELGLDLQAYLERRVVSAYETGALAEARKWVKRNRAFATAVAAAVLLPVIGLAATLVEKNRADRSAVQAAEHRIIAERERSNLLRLSALQEIEDLVLVADELWPVRTELIPRYVAWIESARLLVADLPLHMEERESLRARALPQTEEMKRRDRETHPEYDRWKGMDASIGIQAAKLARAKSLLERDALELDLIRMQTVQEELARLINERRDWRFEKEESVSRWWEKQLSKLIAELQDLDGGLLAEHASSTTHGWSMPKRLSRALYLAEREAEESGDSEL